MSMTVMCATELIKQMGEKYGLALKMSYNTVRGFHVTLHSTGKEGYSTDSLPDEFIKVTKCKNVFSFTTADLVWFLHCLFCLIILHASCVMVATCEQNRC